MKKLIFLLIGILLVGSMVVSAEPRMVLTDVTTNEKPLEPLSWWENFLKIFSREQFIPGLQPLNTRTTLMYVSPTKFVNSPIVDKIYGENCKSYDYIRLYKCDSPTGPCDNVFADDWRIEFPGETLNLKYACAYGDCTNTVYMAQYGNWFLNSVEGKYLAYHCIKAPMEAEITLYNVPQASQIDDTITVTATVEFKGDGKYYVEAGLRKSSEAPFSTQSIIGREVSACDGSINYDGEYVDAISGDKKSFTFTFKDYGIQATYIIDLVVTNGCAIGSNAVSNYKQFDSKSKSIRIIEEPPKYKCVSGVCQQRPDGTYTDNNCGGTCVIPKYKCDGTSCIRDDVGGTYTDNDCNSVCAEAVKKYRCVGNQCERNDILGTYTSSTCDGVCTAEVKKYRCVSGVCEEDSVLGIYTNDPTCGGTCQAATKYSCVSGVCEEDASGTYTDDGCGGACEAELKQLSLTKSQWKTATPKMLIQAMCDYAYQCTELEGFEVVCEYSPEIEARNKKSYEDESPFLKEFIEKFGWVFAGEREYASGTCRATPVSEFDYCKYTEPLAFFSITDNKCQDGLIIIIGGIFLLIVLLPYLSGGGK